MSNEFLWQHKRELDGECQVIILKCRKDSETEFTFENFPYSGLVRGERQRCSGGLQQIPRGVFDNTKVKGGDNGCQA